ncbi:MAG: NAD(+)/NADH kinase [Oscillospiraceae bacterium]|jgi:NAD+ kinase|nr:NAD(+)/NADH kinase [Oscillospiraceae bacterium]
MKIALLPNLTKKESLDCTFQIIDELDKNDCEIFLPEGYQNYFYKTRVKVYENLEKILKICDIIVCVGGDGTFIHNALYSLRYNKPILGINAGRVGFITELNMAKISKLSLLKIGKFKISNRSVVMASILNGDDRIKKKFFAINEIVFSQEKSIKISDFIIFINNKSFNFRGDSLIFSSSTGSSAYSFSAGGPLVDPEIHSIIFNVICPYSKPHRAVVFSENTEILVKAFDPKKKGKMFLLADGRMVYNISRKEKVLIKLIRKKIKFVSFGNKNFYQNFKSKFYS